MFHTKKSVNYSQNNFHQLLQSISKADSEPEDDEPLICLLKH